MSNLLRANGGFDGGYKLLALGDVADRGFKAVASRCKANKSLHAAGFVFIPTNRE